MDCSRSGRRSIKVSGNVFSLMGKFVIYWEKFKGKKHTDFMALCFSATVSSENMHPLSRFIHVASMLVYIVIVTGNAYSCMTSVHQQISWLNSDRMVSTNPIISGIYKIHLLISRNWQTWLPDWLSKGTKFFFSRNISVCSYFHKVTAFYGSWGFSLCRGSGG